MKLPATSFIAETGARRGKKLTGDLLAGQIGLIYMFQNEQRPPGRQSLWAFELKAEAG